MIIDTAYGHIFTLDYQAFVAIWTFAQSTYFRVRREPYPSCELALSTFWLSQKFLGIMPSLMPENSKIRFSACSVCDSRN